MRPFQMSRTVFSLTQYLPAAAHSYARAVRKAARAAGIDSLR